MRLLTENEGSHADERIELLQEFARTQSFNLLYDCSDADQVLSDLVCTCVEIVRSRIEPIVLRLLTNLLTTVLEQSDAVPYDAVRALVIEFVGQGSNAIHLIRNVLVKLAEHSVALQVNEFLFRELYSKRPKMSRAEADVLTKDFFEVVYQLFTIGPSFVARVLSNLELDLQSMDIDRRCAAMELVGRLLSHRFPQSVLRIARSPLVGTHPALLHQCVERLADGSERVRMVAVEAVGKLFNSAAECMDDDLVSDSQEQWSVAHQKSIKDAVQLLRGPFKDRRLDPSEAIRLRMVAIAADVATTQNGFELLSPILHDLFGRLLDKKARVREACAERAASIYALHGLPAWTQGRDCDATKLAWIPQLLCQAYKLFSSRRLGYTAQLEEFIEQHVLGCGADADLDENERARAFLGFYTSVFDDDLALEGLFLLLTRKREANKALRRFLQLRIEKGGPILLSHAGCGKLVFSPSMKDEQRDVDSPSRATALVETLTRCSPAMEDPNCSFDAMTARLQAFDAIEPKNLWNQLEKLCSSLAPETTSEMHPAIEELERLLRVHKLTELSPLLRRAMLKTWLLPDHVGVYLRIWKQDMCQTSTSFWRGAVQRLLEELPGVFPLAFLPHVAAIAEHLRDDSYDDVCVALFALAKLAKNLVSDNFRCGGQATSSISTPSLVHAVLHAVEKLSRKVTYNVPFKDNWQDVFAEKVRLALQHAASAEHITIADSNGHDLSFTWNDREKPELLLVPDRQSFPLVVRSQARTMLRVGSICRKALRTLRLVPHNELPQAIDQIMQHAEALQSHPSDELSKVISMHLAAACIESMPWVGGFQDLSKRKLIADTWFSRAAEDIAQTQDGVQETHLFAAIEVCVAAGSPEEALSLLDATTSASARVACQAIAGVLRALRLGSVPLTTTLLSSLAGRICESIAPGKSEAMTSEYQVRPLRPTGDGHATKDSESKEVEALPLQDPSTADAVVAVSVPLHCRAAAREEANAMCDAAQYVLYALRRLHKQPNIADFASSINSNSSPTRAVGFADRLRMSVTLPALFARAPGRMQRDAAQSLLQTALQWAMRHGSSWEQRVSIIEYAVACFIHMLSRLDAFICEANRLASAFPEGSRIAAFFVDALLKCDPAMSLSKTMELALAVARVCERAHFFVDRERPDCDLVNKAAWVLRYIIEKRRPELSSVQSDDKSDATESAVRDGGMPKDLFTLRTNRQRAAPITESPAAAAAPIGDGSVASALVRSIANAAPLARPTPSMLLSSASPMGVKRSRLNTSKESPSLMRRNLALQSKDESPKQPLVDDVADWVVVIQRFVERKRATGGEFSNASARSGSIVVQISDAKRVQKAFALSDAQLGTELARLLRIVLGEGAEFGPVMRESYARQFRGYWHAHHSQGSHVLGGDGAVIRSPVAPATALSSCLAPWLAPSEGKRTSGASPEALDGPSSRSSQNSSPAHNSASKRRRTSDPAGAPLDIPAPAAADAVEADARTSEPSPSNAPAQGRIERKTPKEPRQSGLTPQAEGNFGADLQGLKLKALKKIAREEGVTNEQMEDTDDTDDPVQSMKDCIIHARKAKTQQAGAAGRTLDKRKNR